MEVERQKVREIGRTMEKETGRRLIGKMARDTERMRTQRDREKKKRREER